MVASEEEFVARERARYCLGQTRIVCSLTKVHVLANTPQRSRFRSIAINDDIGLPTVLSTLVVVAMRLLISRKGSHPGGRGLPLAHEANMPALPLVAFRLSRHIMGADQRTVNMGKYRGSRKAAMN